jgi:hypothetical protein
MGLKKEKMLKQFSSLISSSLILKKKILKEILDSGKVKVFSEDFKELEKIYSLLKKISNKNPKMDLSYEISEFKKDFMFLKNSESFFNYLEEVHAGFKKELGRVVDFLKDKEFNFFITDRDGTINNYCGRYFSSAQSVYNAFFLKSFIEKKVNKAIIITSAPLEGICSLSLFPKDSKKIIYAGSKGREYKTLKEGGKKEERGSLKISKKEIQILKSLERELKKLVSKPKYEKFQFIGSGFQKKFGQLTIARQDISISISKEDSLEFLKEIENVVKELDSNGDSLGIEDTGLDVEIILKTSGSVMFDKAQGVDFMRKKLGLNLKKGNNLVCGDTFSDIPIADKVVEHNKNTYIIFVTTNRKLMEVLRKKHKRLMFVSSPDVLVAALYLLSENGY